MAVLWQKVAAIRSFFTLRAAELAVFRSGLTGKDERPWGRSLSGDVSQDICGVKDLLP